MDAARQAINKFTSHGGTHDTVVDETVNPSVTSETIKPTRHEETTQAVDKEVHQDHYHTTVQPLAHREVLPEQHIHQAMPVQEREFQHGDSSAVQRGVEAEQAAFQSSSRTMDTAHSSSQAAGVTGEHIHHHVHETVQPIVHKETVSPEVVHTTIPIHERHQAPSEHHGLSTMPVKTLDEFQSTGVPLTGTGHRSEHYEGDPRRYNPEMQTNRPDVDVHPERHYGMHDESSMGGQGSGVGTGMATGATGGGLTHGSGSTGKGFATGASGAQNGALRGAESTGQGHGSTGTGTTGNEYASRETSGVTPAHNITTADQSTAHTGGYSTGTTGTTGHTGHTGHSSHTGDNGSTIGNTASHTSSHAPSESTHHHGDHKHVEGHGTSNQIHHGSSLDNHARDDDHQHGDQSRDPAVVDEKTDKKLTGTGADGSHSAVFGLTPDGHKHDDTQHGTGVPKPAHSKDTSGHETNDKETVADQMTNPRVAEKGHDGKAEYDSGSGKPGAGGTGAGQGFGEVRSQDHGASSQMKDKLDPSKDADGDGKKGIMD